MLKFYYKYALPAVAASLIASPAFAQEVPEHGVFILNSLLFLMAGFLVMFMACGFCMLEAGLVRAKNTTMQLTKNVALFSIAAIGYYLSKLVPSKWCCSTSVLRSVIAHSNKRH